MSPGNTRSPLTSHEWKQIKEKKCKKVKGTFLLDVTLKEIRKTVSKI